MQIYELKRWIVAWHNQNMLEWYFISSRHDMIIKTIKLKRNQGLNYKYLPSKQENAGQVWSMVACVADTSGPLGLFYLAPENGKKNLVNPVVLIQKIGCIVSCTRYKQNILFLKKTCLALVNSISGIPFLSSTSANANSRSCIIIYKKHIQMWEYSSYRTILQYLSILDIYQRKTTRIDAWPDDIHISQRFNKRGPITIHDVHYWCEHGKLVLPFHPTN